MFDFKQFLEEGRDAPLYHATNPYKLEEILNDKIIKATTRHRGVVVGHNLTKKYTKSVDSPKLKSLNLKYAFGVSLTRSYKFATRWGSAVLELDQRKLAQRYKIVLVNYWGEKTRTPESISGTSFHNEYEEFVFFKNQEQGIPINYVKRIFIDLSHIPLFSKEFINEKIEKIKIKAKKLNIPVIVK